MDIDINKGEKMETSEEIGRGALERALRDGERLAKERDEYRRRLIVMEDALRLLRRKTMSITSILEDSNGTA